MIRRTLSIPVFAISLVGLTAVASGFHFVRQWQLQRLSHVFLERAEVAEEKKEWRLAAENLDCYVRLNSSSGVDRARLARLFAKDAKMRPEKEWAAELYSRALAAQTLDDPALRAEFAELLLDTGRWLEAENEAKQVLDDPAAARLASRVFAQARYWQWRNGEFGSRTPSELHLIKDFKAGLELDPAHIGLAELAAILYREHPELILKDDERANRETIADSLLNQTVEQNPGDGKAYFARYLYRVRYRQLEGAKEDLQTALRLADDNPQVLLAAAEARYQEALEILDAIPDSAAAANAIELSEHPAVAPLQDAKQLLRRVIDERLWPENSQADLRLGDVIALEDSLIVVGDSQAARDNAIAVWKLALGRFDVPRVQIAFHERIADHLIRAQRIDEARPEIKSIQDLLDAIAGTIPRQDHLALIEAQGLRQAIDDLYRGRYGEAINGLQLTIARQSKLQPNPKTAHAAWDLLGRAYAGLQDWASAATAFDRATNFLPHAQASRLAAAEAWLAAGRYELAIERAEHVEQLPEAALVLGTAELQVQTVTAPKERSWNRLEQTLAALQALPEDSLNAPWRIEFLEADYVALRAADGSDQDYQKAAAEVLRRAELKYEDRAEFWFHACLAYERLAQPEDAERALQRLKNMPGTEAQTAIVASRRAAAQNDLAKAEKILESAVPGLPLAAQERLRGELLLIARAKQDLPRMKAIYSATLKERPLDMGALCGMAELALRDANYEALQKWERELNAAGPAGDIWARYFRIMRLYTSAANRDEPQLQTALSEQGQLMTLRPNWAKSYALLGGIQQRLENWPAAATAYEQAVELGERRYAIFEQLLICLDKAGRPDDAGKYLSRMESYLPASQRLTELASARQLDENEPERAIQIARNRVLSDPSNLGAWLWLGRLFLITHRLPDAKAAFEKATQIAPENPASWNGLFAYHMHMGEHTQARAVLDSVRANVKMDRDHLEHFVARGHIQLGDYAIAEQELSALVARGTKLSEPYLRLAGLVMETDRDRAKRLLQKAIELDPKLAQARWLLATLLAAGGSEEDLEAAEQLLAETGGALASVHDRRVRGLWLSQSRGDQGLLDAIELFEGIVAERPEPTDRLLLAQVYERRSTALTDPQAAEALLEKAREQLLLVAQRPEASASDLGVLISFLFRHDALKTQASNWLAKLEERLKAKRNADPQAIALLIDLRLQQGDVAAQKHWTDKDWKEWLDKLEATDRDPFRPLTAWVKYYAALPKIEAIKPAIEAKAKTLYSNSQSLREQSRVARLIGDLYLQVNLLLDAERWYRIVVQADPEQFPPLAMTLVRQGRGQEAIRLCQAAAEKDETSRPAIVLASVLLESGAKAEYMQQAEPILKAALEKFPDDVNLLYGVGMLRVLEDRYPDAEPLLTKVVSLAPGHVAALNNLAMLVAERPNGRKSALGYVEQAILRRGQQPTLLDTKGTILLWAGNTKDAVVFLKTAARNSSTDPRHGFHLALAHFELGQTDDAQKRLATALEHGLEKQILTPTDRKALVKLRSDLARIADPTR